MCRDRTESLSPEPLRYMPYRKTPPPCSVAAALRELLAGSKSCVRRWRYKKDDSKKHRPLHLISMPSTAALAMEDREVVSRSWFCHQTKRDADRSRPSNPTAGGQSDS